LSTKRDNSSEPEKTFNVAHCTHCGGSCLLKVHVKNGVITRIETDDGDEPQYRACARGRAFRQRVYAKDRVLYPLKRTGQRGEGKFAQISWDEGLSTVASELIRVRDTYGAASILFKFSMGDAGQLQNIMHRRLLNMAGGCSEVWGVASAEGAIFNQIATFGTDLTMNSREDLFNSKLIILWGCNPGSMDQYYVVSQPGKRGGHKNCVHRPQVYPDRGRLRQPVDSHTSRH
jgi:anaerobic dimethyl sulfoxide reductase subunit A